MSFSEFLKSDYFIALWFGAFSGLSLPLGALVGSWVKLSQRTIAAIMSFGAGALIAAITYELIAPAFERSGFYPISLGCIIGCGVFVGMDQILNSQGAFARKSSLLVAHLRSKKRKHVNNIIAKLSEVDILRALPPEEIQDIVQRVQLRSFPAGTKIFSKGDTGDAMYIIQSGKVKIDKHEAEAINIAPLEQGQTFGEMALLWREPRNADAIAETDVKTWKIHRDDFNALIDASPRLKEAVSDLADTRKRTGSIPHSETDAAEWKERALESIREDNYRPTTVEIKKAETEGGGTALALWLGILLDSIPESMVIGASLVGSKISAALVVGLFIANAPESISSATMMKRRGSKTLNIFLMWLSIMIIIGLGSMLGNLTFKTASHSTHSIFEGLAAGSMLAMTAQTMLPEAYEQGGWLVGVLTVLGFLAALFFKG